MRQEHAALQQAYPPETRQSFSPAEAISHKLAFKQGSPDQEKSEFFGALRYAWDALAYEGFAPGSHSEQLSGAVLSQVYNHNRVHETPEPSVIHLTDPMQVKMLDAMAEAAEVPRTPGQAEIPIPRQTQNYTDTLLSAEYHARLKAAAAQKRKEAPSESWLAPAGTSHRTAGQSDEGHDRSLAHLIHR